MYGTWLGDDHCDTNDDKSHLAIPLVLHSMRKLYHWCDDKTTGDESPAPGSVIYLVIKVVMKQGSVTPLITNVDATWLSNATGVTNDEHAHSMIQPTQQYYR